MNARQISHISKENQFSLSQINEDTSLIFVDEWSSSKLDEDRLKNLLQGGAITITRKFENSEVINVNCPIYITTNLMPQFKHKASIDCRIEVFNTKEIPDNLKVSTHLFLWGKFLLTAFPRNIQYSLVVFVLCTVTLISFQVPFVETIFRDDAMKYLHWIAEQINLNRHLIPREDLFYENCAPSSARNSAVKEAYEREMQFLRHGQINSRESLVERSTLRTHRVSKWLFSNMTGHVFVHTSNLRF